jgi:hypothetical protein
MRHLALGLVWSVLLAASDAQLASAERLLRSHLHATRPEAAPCLQLEVEGQNESAGWLQFAARETHDARCPGDPATAPVIDRFRVYPEQGTIHQWMPSSDTYEPVLQGKPAA